MTNKANEPAFPNSHPEFDWMPGLTKRELFAAMAMQGILSNPNPTNILGSTEVWNPLKVSVVAKSYAESLLTVLDAQHPLEKGGK